MSSSSLNQPTSAKAVTEQPGFIAVSFDQGRPVLDHSYVEQDESPLPLAMTLPLTAGVSLLLWAGIWRIVGVFLHN